MPADHRSAHPNIPGVPWWGAILIAVVSSAIGFAFDAGSGGGELTGVFSALFALGCLAAVLAVRQGAVFTAVIQPPLILFVVVPAAYYLMHSSDIHGIKDILINCGYPLIERFPLMFFTSAAVLLIGIARWYLGASARHDAPAAEEAPSTGGGLSAKLSSLLGGRPDADPADREARRRHKVDRRPSAPKPAAERGDRAARGARPVKRAGAPSRSRHTRPPDTEIIEPVADMDRPRRRRPRPDEPSPAPTAEPRRRPRSPSGRDPRAMPPSERRAAHERTERRERDRERPQRPQRRSRYDGWSGSDDYEPLEPHGPSGNGSYHPVSRVRYRGADESADGPEYRTRRRAPRDNEPDRWEYDI